MIAIIENKKVANVIVATLDEAKAVFPDAILVETETAGVGWLWDGKTFTPPLPPPPTAPESVPMAEARKVMRKAGVLEPIRSLVRVAGADAEDDFEYQPRIRRQHPLVLAAIARGILTAEKADELFIDAAKLAGQAL